MNYAEHRRRQRECERERFARMSPKEKFEQWYRRANWLIRRYLEQPELATATDKCPKCHPGYQLVVHHWPDFFVCHCGTLCIVDRFSHRCPDDVERVVLEPLTGLKESFIRMPEEYPLEQRLGDLRGESK